MAKMRESIGFKLVFKSNFESIVILQNKPKYLIEAKTRMIKFIKKKGWFK